MRNGERFLARWRPHILSILRIVAGFLIATHGAQKLFGFPTPLPGGPVHLLSLFGVAGVVETVGGILLLLGLFTRIAGFVLAGEMAVAYFMMHAPRGFWPLLNQGELAVIYCFAFLYFAAAGGGEWSLDRAIRRR
jgi:putative oxidoreductase